MLALLLIPGVFSLAEQVDTYSWNDADVDFNAETGTITAYHGMAAYLAIPAEIDGATVKSIGPNVFAENETLIGIILPEGLETVEEAAFSHCASLTRAEFPATLQKIYAKAFDGCEALQEIHLKIEDARIAIFAAARFRGLYQLEPDRRGGGMPRNVCVVIAGKRSRARPELRDHLRNARDRAVYNGA